jgi:hypothetical protein
VTASGRSHVVSWTVGVKYPTASLIERRISPRNSVTVGRVASTRSWAGANSANHSSTLNVTFFQIPANRINPGAAVSRLSGAGIQVEEKRALRRSLPLGWTERGVVLNPRQCPFANQLIKPTKAVATCSTRVPLFVSQEATMAPKIGQIIRRGPQHVDAPHLPRPRSGDPETQIHRQVHSLSYRDR